MKRYLAITAASIALATPAIATAGTPGFVDVSLGAIDTDVNEITTMSAGGSVVAPLSGNWNVQFDGEFTRYQQKGGGLSGAGLSSHVFYDGGDWAVGALLNYQDATAVTFYTLGAEAQYTVGSFVFEAGAGFGTGEVSLLNENSASASASLTWYANADLSFTGSVTHRDTDTTDPDIIDVTSFGLNGEYRFDGSPYSVVGGYTFSDLDNGFESNAWSVGLRYGFGDATLQDRRKDGPRWLREERNVTNSGG
ncbi:MAG: hypothetical protein ACK6DM_12875 [Alphaproteobacteria bacterium]